MYRAKLHWPPPSKPNRREGNQKDGPARREEWRNKKLPLLTPRLPTRETRAEQCHRFICTSCLRLGIRYLSLSTLPALKACANASLSFRYHRLVHILLLYLSILFSPLCGLEFIVSHPNETIRCHFICEDANSESG